MGWGPSAIYTIEHERGWKIEDLRLSDSVVERAEKGNLHFQTKICIQFRNRIEKDFGGDPGFVYFEELVLTKTRVIPAAAKRPPKMKSASSELSHVRTAGQNSRR